MFYETEKEFTNKNECILYAKEQGCTLPNFKEKENEKDFYSIFIRMYLYDVLFSEHTIQ